ncbi:DEAD/DEAH box helicase [Actinomadura rudentiformis]|uniref:Uncharacterized protein n=1 Tax=Actinomadura rudentiformis TaxID=359158 RepID=A0A6H9YS58_9ACTN|nr:hypothetical protein [Actinomadura rudentiformis]KAB2343755.1 hypothetical protein F8566_34140 [Actinomadura rudentiformis]
MAKELAVHLQFLRSMGELKTVDYKRVRETVRAIAHDYEGAGLRKHKVGSWVSFSAGMDLRVFAAETDHRTVLTHVAHHDVAYRWAENHTAVIDPDDELLAVLPGEQAIGAKPPASPSTRSDGSAGQAGPSRFAVSEARLVGFGVPRPLAEQLARRRDEDLLEVLSYLAPELQENVLSVLAEQDVHPSVTSARPSDVVVVDDEMLEFALTLPTELWRVFLHPRQRYVVDLPIDQHVLVRGGPGTGKTVAMAHRFLRLTQECRRTGVAGPVLLVLNNVTRQIVIRQLTQLGVLETDIDVRLVSELPKGRNRLLQVLGEVGPLVIDEGQDLPVTFVAALAEFLDSSRAIPPLTLSYDVNQAIFHPSEKALSKLRQDADLITLTYCYRSTKEIIDTASAILANLHTNYTGRDFQNRHHVDAVRDPATARMRTPISGPKVKVLLATEPQQLCARTTDIIQRFLDRYGGPSGLAVIVAADQPSSLVQKLRSALAKRSVDVPVITPSDAKGEEYLAGVVVDGFDHPVRHNNQVEEVTIGRYKSVSGLYVAVTRFRDRLVIVTSSVDSPIQIPN